MSDPNQPGSTPRSAGAPQESTTELGRDSSRAGAAGTSGSEPAPALSPEEHLEDSAPAPGHTLAGRYTVLDLLGQGGMGQVLAAYDARLDRRVALKLLHYQLSSSFSDSGGALETRMLREAQAMARLNHPNVVAVYDAGTLEDSRIFIAMEMVEGQTLRQWTLQKPRSWRELLEKYLAAGRGLAAAHEAGLVHRDFKPDNVLVGADGRARVTDFGVARAESPSSTSRSLATPLPETSASWESNLTVPGAVVGTPKYMAPELLLGELADARSDLFSYCVALYEALFGQPPFAGASTNERMQARIEGRITPPPTSSTVPSWVASAVLQGLQPDPQQRPPSMRALLAILEDDPEVRRRARLRAAALVAVMGVLAGLAAVGWLRRQEQQPGCALMAQRLAGVWDEPTKARVQQALLGTRLPYAQETLTRVVAALDDYAVTWVRMRTEACEASQGRGELPQDLAPLQASCLERRRSPLRALTELLARGPDQEFLPKAVQAVQSLPPLAACGDSKALASAVPEPQEPALRERVRALQEQVDQLQVLRSSGKYREGVERGEALLREVADVEYAPLRARLMVELAALRSESGDMQGAEALVRQALPLASRAEDDELLAEAWGLLISLVGERQGRPEEAAGLMLTVEVAQERAKDERIRAAVLDDVAMALFRAGRYDEARAQFERALGLRQRALRPEHPALATSFNNLGNIFGQMGRYEESYTHHQRALELRQTALGAEHPLVALSLANLGNALSYLGRYEEARVHHERSLALQEKLLGPEHPELVYSHSNLANALMQMGRYEQAQAHYERALALGEKTLGPEHPDLAFALNGLGLLLMQTGRYAQAQALYGRSVSIQEKALGPEHPYLGYALSGLGRTLIRNKQLDKASRHLARALALEEKGLGHDNPDLVEPLVGLGELHMARHQPDQALLLLERALAIAQPHSRAEVQLTLACALWAAGGSRARAQSLATEARELFQRAGHEPMAAEASRWLAAHPAP